MVSKEELLKLAARARSGGFTVYAPVRGESSVLLSELGDGDEIDLDHVITVNTLKDVLLPRCETLASFDLNELKVTPVDVSQERVLVIGTRPCDAAAIEILDSILIGDVRDTRYADRRERTVIVTVACSRFDEACFCSSMGYGPHDTTGSDVVLLPRGDEFVVRSSSPRGKQFLEEMDLKEDDAAEADRPPDLTRTVNTDGLKDWLGTNFDNPRWERVSDNCVSCGTCYYLCPTCHCYDITDEAGISRGERVRIWDCCSFSGFTKMAAHQPRVGRHARYRQRVMHKFKYTVDNVGKVACVGDGRCVRHCPYGVDICEILEALPGKE
jgi:ferredoxin